MMSPPLVCNTCGATNQLQAAYCRACGSSLHGSSSQTATIYHSVTGQLLANVVLKQRYRIITLVGKGGMGAVYKAEDTLLGNRQVALKEMIQSGLSPQEQNEAADAFKQEAILLACLQHPNLPSIFDHFEENGRWYLVMSFIKGETLADYLSHSQRGKLPLDEVLQIGTQLCTVLGYLHNQQPAVIFRDLKPSNIMRTPDGHVYLIDFGIARHFKGNQTRDTRIGYTPGYAPPEQYGRAQTSPRSDIYSMGVVLYQLLSGHNPSTTPFQFPSLHLQVPTIPIELATLITHMLELDENKRPTSVLIVNQKLQGLIISPRTTPSLQPTVAAGTPPISLPIQPQTQQPTTTSPKAVVTFQKRPAIAKNWGCVAIGVVFLAAYVLLRILSIFLPTSTSNIGIVSGGSPSQTQTTSEATERWKGVFHQPGHSAVNVELDVLSKNGGNFSGTWMSGNQGSGRYDIGTVSVAGQTALFSSLPGQVQTDLQSSFGSISIDANTKVVLWRGQGNASNIIWPTGYYYAFREGDMLNGVAYEYLGGDKSTFDISIQGGGSSSLGT